MLMQFGDLRVGDGEARRLRVATKALEKLGARGLQSQNQIEVLLAARGTTAGFAILTEHKDWAAYLFSELARDQTNDAFVPASFLAIHQDDLFISLELCLLAHQAHQFLGLLLASKIQLFQLCGQGSSFSVIVGGEQAESHVGVFHAPGSVDPGGQNKRDVAFAYAAWLQS